VIVWSDSPCERIRQWRLVDFEREQIVGARLAGSSVTKTATLLGVLIVTVSNFTAAYMNHGKTSSSEEEQWAKINIDRKREDCLKNHRTTAAHMTGEQN
jgi:hypothetical protein